MGDERRRRKQYGRKLHGRKPHSHKSIDAYACVSRLKEWNASYKEAFALLSILLVLLMDSIRFSLFTVLFMGCLSVGVGKIRLYDYIRLLLLPAAFIMTGGIAVLIQFGSGVGSLLSFPFLQTGIYITRGSLFQSLHLAGKALGAVSCLYMLTLSTPMGEIISVLRKLHVPGILVELMHLIYRYIFILLEINAAQKDAVRSRLGYCDRKTAIRTFGKELANLFILSMQRAESYYDALESRGYEDGCLFWEEKRKMTAGQAAWAAGYMTVAVLMLFW